MHAQTQKAGAEFDARLHAKVLRDVLAAESFANLADLKEAFKVRCARLRIRYDADVIERALTLVESNRPLIARPSNTGHSKPCEEQPPLGRLEARDAYDAVTKAVGQRLIKPWPGPTRTPAEHEAIVRDQVRDYHQTAYRQERAARHERRRAQMTLSERLVQIFKGR